MLLTLLLSTADAACEEPTSLSNVMATINTAEVAYGQLQTERFQQLAEQVNAEIPCVSDLVSREDARVIHRLMALRARVAGDSAKARTAFAASRWLEPTAGLPDHIVPDDRSFPEWADFEGIPLDTRATRPLTPPRTGQLYLDGAPAQERPVAWPVIYQQVTASGQVQRTRYLWAEDPLPVIEERSPRGPLVLGGVSAATLAAGAGLYASGWYVYRHNGCEQGCADDQHDYATTMSDVVGPALMAVGGAGLAGTGAWMWMGAGTAGVGYAARW
jgi:hypothetical protein